MATGLFRSRPNSSSGDSRDNSCNDAAIENLVAGDFGPLRLIGSHRVGHAVHDDTSVRQSLTTFLRRLVGRSTKDERAGKHVSREPTEQHNAAIRRLRVWPGRGMSLARSRR